MPKSVWEALKAAAGTPQAPSPRQMLSDLFGTARRGGPDTAKAAQALGVSRRTVQRWAHDGLPDSQVAKRLQRRHRRWRNESQAGRRAALAPVQGRALAGSFSGKIRISQDRRTRHDLGFILDAKQIDSLLDVAATSGRRDLHAAFEHALARDVFGGSVQIEQIHNLELR